MKLYRDAASGLPKGDALVTYEKDAAVLGAIQLLSGSELRHGRSITISRPVWGPKEAAPAAGGAPAHSADSGAARSSGAIFAPARLIPGLAPSRAPPPTLAPAPSATAGPGTGVSAGGTAEGAGAWPKEEQLRVVVVRRLFLPSEVPPASDVTRRRAWISEIVDEIWSEACRHGEVERIEPLLDGNALNSTEGCVAIRFQSVLGAAAAVDALDGRLPPSQRRLHPSQRPDQPTFHRPWTCPDRCPCPAGRYFAERSLAASFDDGRAVGALPAGADVGRQQRFGFGEMAQAFQESLRVLRLAAAEGAPFIACAQFLCEVEHYGYFQSAAEGAGYYRHADAPPPDPMEQSQAILLQASEAGAIFVACAQPLDGLDVPLHYEVCVCTCAPTCACTHAPSLRLTDTSRAFTAVCAPSLPRTVPRRRSRRPWLLSARRGAATHRSYRGSSAGPP